MNERLQHILDRLEGVRRNGASFQARCPAHDDRRPSLSLNQGDDGRVLLHCFAGCEPGAVVGAMGLAMADVMPEQRSPTYETPRHRAPAGVLSDVGPTARAKTYPTAAAAVAELERRRGRRTAAWTYHNECGEPVGLIVRWDRPGAGKVILPVSRIPGGGGGGWAVRGLPVPRPLYGLPELLRLGPGADVYVTEGEKAACTARSIGLMATTSPHGSGSAAKADWSPLAGKNVVILPDNDAAGRAYAADVVLCLLRLSPLPTVRIVELPGLPDGGDIADFLQAGGDR